LNESYSMVVVAGLGAASTLQAAPKLVQHGRRTGQVLLLPHGGPEKLLVLAAEVAGSPISTNGER
jgi:hypothetical protein